MMVAEYIRQYKERMDAKIFKYFKNDVGKVVYESKSNGEDCINSFGSWVRSWRHCRGKDVEI